MHQHGWVGLVVLISVFLLLVALAGYFYLSSKGDLASNIKILNNLNVGSLEPTPTALPTLTPPPKPANTSSENLSYFTITNSGSQSTFTIFEFKDNKSLSLFSFVYPNSWKLASSPMVKETQTITVSQNKTSLTFSTGQAAAQGCAIQQDPNSPKVQYTQTKFTGSLGEQPLELNDECAQNYYYISGTTSNNQPIRIAFGLGDKSAKSTIESILKSVNGITVNRSAPSI